MRKLILAIASLALSAQPALAVTVSTTLIGNPNNAADDTTFGAVNYTYAIGTYEVTNAQYAEFLNAVAASDPTALYRTSMGSDATYGGITRSGSDGSYTYAAKAGFENKPVVYVNFYDTLRFANWLHNGQGGAGTTETGAYTLLGGTPIPSNGTSVSRNTGALWFLPSEDEWYKAAFYEAATTSYYEYPTGSNTAPTAEGPPGTDLTNGSANYNNAVGVLTDVGAYSAKPSTSPYGTYDQGGNVWEWDEEPFSGGVSRGLRGGCWACGANNLAASGAGARFVEGVHSEGAFTGFRVATVPEPATGLLVMGGVLGLAVWRRRRLH